MIKANHIPKKKKNKYRNTWTECRQGHKHQSKKEALYCNDLWFLERAGEIQIYSIQKEFNLYAFDPTFKKSIPEKNVGKIKVDFYVINKLGEPEVHEVKCKATKTPFYKLKKKIFVINNPEIKFKVIE